MEIDSFSIGSSKVIEPEENKKSKKLWDIPEDKNTCVIDIGDKMFIVNNTHNKNNNIKACQVLYLMYNYIYKLKQLCKEYLDSNPNSKHKSALGIFIITPHTIQEITFDCGFHGLNKPKGIIKYNKDNFMFNKDNDLRAERRHILFEIRTKNGKFKNLKFIKDLLIHEVSHTLCNHIRYRDEGNHEKDFDDNEKMLLMIANSSDEIKDIENTLSKIIK